MPVMGSTDIRTRRDVLVGMEYFYNQPTAIDSVADLVSGSQSLIARSLDFTVEEVLEDFTGFGQGFEDNARVHSRMSFDLTTITGLAVPDVLAKVLTAKAVNVKGPWLRLTFTKNAGGATAGIRGVFLMRSLQWQLRTGQVDKLVLSGVGAGISPDEPNVNVTMPAGTADNGANTAAPRNVIALTMDWQPGYPVALGTLTGATTYTGVAAVAQELTLTIDNNPSDATGFGMSYDKHVTVHPKFGVSFKGLIGSDVAEFYTSLAANRASGGPWVRVFLDHGSATGIRGWGKVRSVQLSTPGSGTNAVNLELDSCSFVPSTT